MDKQQYNKLTTNDIRRMLDAWYEATLSPEDETILAQWFAETPDEDIPADLMADARLLRSMYAPVTLTEAELARLDRTVSRLTAVRTPRFVIWQRILAAACLAAVIVTACVWGFGSDLTPEAGNSLSAVTARIDDPDNLTPEEAEEVLRASLGIVDRSMRAGTDGMSTADKSVQRMADDISRTMQKL